MHKASHPQINLDKLNLPKKAGGRKLHRTEDKVVVESLAITSYVSESEEEL